MEKNELIEFEIKIAKKFEKGEIHYPVHLSGGNEYQLINIFKDIKKERKFWISQKEIYRII